MKHKLNRERYEQRIDILKRKVAGERAALNDALQLVDELKEELRNTKATLDGYRQTALIQERRINELDGALHRHHDSQVRKPYQIGCGYCGLPLPVRGEEDLTEAEAIALGAVDPLS